MEFAEALELAGFDGLADLPVAPVLDPLLGLALTADPDSPVDVWRGELALVDPLSGLPGYANFIAPELAG